ncbi:MAG: dissimilatory sulfite reductase D family protein [Candidatus Latescibacterota bacterium]
MNEEVKNAILGFFEKKRKIKARLPMADIVSGLSDLNRRDVKTTIMEMANEGLLKVWSSGSSSYYMMPDDFKKLTDAGADGHA